MCANDAPTKVFTSPNWINLGGVHTHQAAKFLNKEARKAINQVDGDGNKAIASGKPSYAFDEQNVDIMIPGKKYARGVLPVDNIATTSNLYDGSFSILRHSLNVAANNVKLK